MEQRYKRPADWNIINAAAEAVSIPVVGNGDLLTLFETEHRRQTGSTHALMTGRGALVKPWIFEEYTQVHSTPCAELAIWLQGSAAAFQGLSRMFKDIACQQIVGVEVEAVQQWCVLAGQGVGANS
jgi:tRNA-dihydrouridine synthase